MKNEQSINGIEPIIDLIWSIEDVTDNTTQGQNPALPPAITANCGGCATVPPQCGCIPPLFNNSAC